MKKSSYSSRCFLILMMITLVLSMMACKKTVFPAADDSVKGFFTALSKADLKEAEKYCKSDTGNFTFADPQEEKLITLIFSKLNYEIVSSEEDGDTATVGVKLTNLDMQLVFEDMYGKIFDEAYDAALSEEEMSDDDVEEKMMGYLEEGMSDPEAPVVTNEFEITLKKDNGKKIWVIQDDDTFMSNITGNLDEMLSE
ncbi:DUF5105 domain-containing protein [Anaerocolumna sp. AGMB13020]|uniref:DUF5105 domain-containing protein n=1 Tax=Anaerocolumna sp. AGMB13020 TaxID=3081750 RepID=UPI00295406D1|nr:DUF5105 domain-containing protein [Anaerocolumna sp. AGMB13020]WOO35891.1 DUF5105 domain-containing protein [Anaerocolumna sp. AGMB13020]